MISDTLKNAILNDFQQEKERLTARVNEHRSERKASKFIMMFMSHQYLPVSVEYDYNKEAFTELVFDVAGEKNMVHIALN